MRISDSTSARCGTFSSVSVSSVRSEAIISGRLAFFAPEIGMTPLSAFPPVILIWSICAVPGPSGGPFFIREIVAAAEIAVASV